MNKVKTAEGELPLKVKRDAHDIILDFIRSRPPLKPASRRKLAPLRKYSTPQELLLTDIASENAKKSLRKTSGPPIPKLSLRKYIKNYSFLSNLNISSSRTRIISNIPYLNSSEEFKNNETRNTQQMQESN